MTKRKPDPTKGPQVSVWLAQGMCPERIANVMDVPLAAFMRVFKREVALNGDDVRQKLLMLDFQDALSEDKAARARVMRRAELDATKRSREPTAAERKHQEFLAALPPRGPDGKILITMKLGTEESRARIFTRDPEEE